MAEPLSIIGAVASILQISSMVVKLVKGAKGAASERQMLLVEINATTALCQTLCDYIEIEGKPWTETLEILNQTDDAPLQQFRKCLEYLHKKMTSESRTDHMLQVWVQNLKWPFTKGEVLDLVASIERQKSLFTTALAKDNHRLSIAIRDETLRIARKLDAVQLTQKVQDHQAQQTAKTIDEIRLRQDIEDQKRQSQEAQVRRQALLAQLTTIDFQATHTDVSSRRAQNTGHWVLECSEYVSWRSKRSSSVLWCHGIPGAGKTILASLIIDRLRESEVTDYLPGSPSARCGVAGIYCNYKSPQTTPNVLGSLLQQLLLPLSNFSEVDDTSADPKNILAPLLEVVKHFSNTFIIVDALDECPTRVELLQALRQLVDSTAIDPSDTVLHILVTSRDSVKADIERELKPNGRLEIRSNEADVRNYLRQTLCMQGQVAQWIEDDPHFGALILDSVSSKVAGMFLLARLYADLLANIPTKRSVRRALDRLPTGIDDTYTEAWTRMSAQSPEQFKLGKTVLAWIIHATRPLKVREIQEALAIEEGDEMLDPEGLLDVARLISFCAGLVIVNDQRQLVTLIHPTTQEYFNTRKESFFPAAHEEIAIVCITYLRIEAFQDEGALQDLEAFTYRRRSYALLGYAAVNWGTHVRRSRSQRATNLAVTLLQDKQSRMAAYQALLLNTVGERDHGTEWPELGLPDWATPQINEFEVSSAALGNLHLAAYFGLIDAAEVFLVEGTKVDVRDSLGGTPLHWALYDRQDEMLKYLLFRGADPNIERDQSCLRRWHMLGCFTLPLAIAAYMGNTAAIQTLIERGAEIDRVEDKTGNETALSVALYARQDEATKLLLAKGADVNKCFVGISNTAMYGTLDTLRMLLKSGANAENVQEALRGAASAGQRDKAALLLQHGANPNGSSDISEWQENNLSLTSSPSEQSHIDDGDEDWPAATPLVSAIASQRPNEDTSDQYRCVLCLLDAGADVNGLSARNYFYPDDFITPKSGYWTAPLWPTTTPLFTAAYFRRPDNIRELVRRGADVNFVMENQITALSSALDGESYDDSTGADGALSSSNQVRKVVQLLIELGADPGLCAPRNEKRINELLGMSPQECEHMTALQRVVVQPHWTLDDESDRSFRERRDELRTLIAAGAEPKLCCARDKRRIKEFLGWSEHEIEALDKKLEAYHAVMKQIEFDPL